MKRVIIESPFSGDVDGNRKYLRECLRDSLDRGEAPFASHGLYTWVLDDTIPEERNKGIQAGFAWGEKAELIAVYEDRGISRGMAMGIKNASLEDIPVEFRKIR